MVDRKNKGGKSLVLRCASAIRCESGCPFYAKLRRSNKDGMWYICVGLQQNHMCPPEAFPPNTVFVERMMAARQVPECDDNSKDEDTAVIRQAPLQSMLLLPSKEDTAI